GDLNFNNNCFYDVVSAGTGATASDLFKIAMGSGWASPADSTSALTSSNAALQASFASNGNEVANPGIEINLAEGTNGLIPVPTNDVSASPSSDSWFTAAGYKGAFDPSENCTWLTGWSFLDQRGFLGCANSIEEIAFETQLNVMPNPSNGTFEISMDSDLTNGSIEIVDLTGRVIFSKNINFLSAGSRMQVELDAPTGIYLLQVRQLNNLRTTRIVVR
ncbi:MAG: T9SS type A sorting domain-containing protein, partial [Flavobacteriales bacterium]|nr:T9SS type A sorting domain-containing protein [Flavobacteriales bacterium]